MPSKKLQDIKRRLAEEMAEHDKQSASLNRPKHIQPKAGERRHQDSEVSFWEEK